MSKNKSADESGHRFQAIWNEALSRISEATGQSRETLASALQETRQALASAATQSWEEFAKTEAFQKSVSAAVERAQSLRSSAREVFKAARQETQGVTRDDFEMLNRELKNAEQLLLTRMDLLEQRLLKSNPARKPRARKRSS